MKTLFLIHSHHLINYADSITFDQLIIISIIAVFLIVVLPMLIIQLEKYLIENKKRKYNKQWLKERKEKNK